MAWNALFWESLREVLAQKLHHTHCNARFEGDVLHRQTASDQLRLESPFLEMDRSFLSNIRGIDRLALIVHGNEREKLLVGTHHCFFWDVPFLEDFFSLFLLNFLPFFFLEASSPSASISELSCFSSSSRESLDGSSG